MANGEVSVSWVSGSDWGGPAGFGRACTGRTPVFLSLQTHNSFFWQMLKVRFLYTITEGPFVSCIQLQKDSFRLISSWWGKTLFREHPVKGVLGLSCSLDRPLADWLVALNGPCGGAGRTLDLLFTAWAFFVETWWILSSMWLCHPVSILAIHVLWQCDVGPWIQHHAGGRLHISLHNYLTVQ